LRGDSRQWGLGIGHWGCGGAGVRGCGGERGAGRREQGAGGYLGTPCRALPSSTPRSSHQPTVPPTAALSGRCEPPATPPSHRLSPTRHSAFVIRHSCLWVPRHSVPSPSIFYTSLQPPTNRATDRCPERSVRATSDAAITPPPRIRHSAFGIRDSAFVQTPQHPSRSDAGQ
jgi:hypothetical protein